MARLRDDVVLNIVEEQPVLLGNGRSRLPPVGEAIRECDDDGDGNAEEGATRRFQNGGIGSYRRLASHQAGAGAAAAAASPKRLMEVALGSPSPSRSSRSSPSRPSPPARAKRTATFKPVLVEETDSSSDAEEEQAAAAAAGKKPALTRRPTAAAAAGGSPAEVLKAPTNFNRLKSKSRLADPAPPPTIYSSPTAAATPPPAGAPPPSTPPPEAEEEEDPLAEQAAHEEDLPEKYRRMRMGYYTIFQLCSLLLLGAFLPCTLVLEQLKHRSIWGLQLWRWSLLAIIVLSGRLISGWFINLLVFIIERNFLWKKRVVYFVYALRKGVQTLLWLTLCFIAWLSLFDPRVERSTKNHTALTNVTKVLTCFLIAAFIWLAKLLFVKVLASSYHVSTYFDRIQESMFNQYILEKLSGPPLDDVLYSQQLQPAAGTKKDASDKISWDKLQLMNQMNISAWNMKRMINVVKQTGISTFSQTIEETDSEIQTEQQARTAAKIVFKNVAKHGRKYLILEDLLRFLTEDEAHKALSLFEGATEYGKITKKGLVNWVTNVYRERRSLALSLNDTKTAVNKLHKIINAVVIVIIGIIWLLVLGLATSHLLVVASSQLLLIVFVFGNTAKTIFEAIIFLFVMHPYDVGDRCVVDGVQMVVEEMNILTTVFLRYDNEKIYYPNAVLASKAISNFYRSPDMGDAIEFSVHMSTPMEKIAALKAKIGRYIETHSHHWHAKFTVVVKEVVELNKMTLALWTQHTMNHQNSGERWERRSELLVNVKNYCQELAIEYHPLAQEIILTSKVVPVSAPTLVG